MDRHPAPHPVYYLCAACQVTGLGPRLAPGRVRCWCCGRPVPARNPGTRAGPRHLKGPPAGGPAGG